MAASGVFPSIFSGAFESGIGTAQVARLSHRIQPGHPRRSGCVPLAVRRRRHARLSLAGGRLHDEPA